MGFRRSLALLVAGTLVPLLVFSVVAVHQYGRERSTAAGHALQDAARAHVIALDKHLEATIAALRVLGISEHLDAGDWRAFYQQCLRAIASRPEWRTISLFDRDGRRLLITSEPFGSSLPGPPQPMAEPFRRLVETRTPNVSDLFQSPLSHRYGVSVGVPITRGDEVRWVLSAGMSPDTLGKLVASPRALTDGTVTILDRRHRVVASSRAQHATGDAAPAWLAKIATGAAEGISREATPDGGAALSAFSRSEVFGWTAAITVPVSGGFVPRPVPAILGAGVTLLVIGLAIAAWAGRRISRPIEALALAAKRIGRGETVEPVPSGITEVAALSAALVGASEDRARAEADRAAASEQLEQRVRERTQELEAANQELDAFSYSISHDLRAPLRAMQGFTEALLEDYGERLDGAGHDYARRIVAASHRMDLLIQDLLAYSRLSRVEVKLDPVDVETVVDEVCGQLAAELKGRGAEISVDRPLGRVMAHRTVFSQILANLISNAVKFVAPNTRPRIRIRTDPHGDWVRLWVEDNGIGIRPEHRERIFRAFERLHGVDAYPGTGIGLAIVHKGATRLGGRAGVESTPGQGSRFWVELKSAEA